MDQMIYGSIVPWGVIGGIVPQWADNHRGSSWPDGYFRCLSAWAASGNLKNLLAQNKSQALTNRRKADRMRCLTDAGHLLRIAKHVGAAKIRQHIHANAGATLANFPTWFPKSN